MSKVKREQSQRELIKTLNAEIEAKNSEIKTSAYELKLAKEAYQKLGKKLNEFIGKRDHEIRAAELEAETRYNDKVKAVRKEASEAVNKLKVKLEDVQKELLLLQTSQDNMLKIKTKELNIKLELANAEIESKESISKQKHEIEISKLQGMLDIETNRARLFQEILEGRDEGYKQLLQTIQVMGIKNSGHNKEKALPIMSEFEKKNSGGR